MLIITQDTQNSVAAQEGSVDDQHHLIRNRHDDTEDDYDSADVKESDHSGVNSEDTKYFSNNVLIDVENKNTNSFAQPGILIGDSF